jgi:hypothetical protein
MLEDEKEKGQEETLAASSVGELAEQSIEAPA